VKREEEERRTAPERGQLPEPKLGGKESQELWGKESQELRGKETVRGRKPGGQRYDRSDSGPPVQAFHCSQVGASSAMTDSAEFLESDE